MNQIDNSSEKFLTRPLMIIFLTVFIDLIGFGIVIPLLPFFAEEFAASPVDVGLLMSSYSLMQFVFAPVWGGISDRFGRKPILFFTILGSGIGYLILGFAGSLVMIYAGRILSGIMGGNLSTAQAYVADVTSRENRARGMGLFGMAFGLGFILGPALAGVLSKFGNQVPFLFAAGLSFLNAFLVLTILPESLKKGDTANIRRPGRLAALASSFRSSGFGLIIGQYFLLITAFSIMTTAFAFYTAVKFGYDAEHTGYLLSYIGFLAAITQGGIFGILAKRYGEKKLAAGGTLVLALSLFAVPFIGKDFGGVIGLLIGTGIFAIGNSIASPSLMSLASKSAGDAAQGQALGLMQSGASLARVVGPLICGFLLNNRYNKVDGSTLLRTFSTAAIIMLAAFAASVYSLLTEQKGTAVE
jgi:DHA1 family tetracycline resistance protein-like MFS transporter